MRRHQAYWVIQTSHLGDYDNVTISLQLGEKSLSCLYSRLLSLLKICLFNNKIQYVDLTHQLRQYIFLGSLPCTGVGIHYYR